MKFRTRKTFKRGNKSNASAAYAALKRLEPAMKKALDVIGVKTTKKKKRFGATRSTKFK